MKWNEIVSINKLFLPVCDIKSDDGSYWQTFICHDDFYQLLKNTLNMYQKKQKSVWLQGTFGSGKTHATTVIKNLLSNEFSGISDYIEHAIKEPQVKPALVNFRTEFKTFPIILKGSYYINDSKTFDYAIQQEVVNALKSANINEPLQNSYDDMINRIEKNRTFWNEIISDSRLIDEVSDVNELIGELKRHNDSILRLCEDELTKRGIGVITSNIIKFLESAASIVKKYGYSHITLFWDEFTPILEVNKYNDIFNSLQNLSENIKNGNVFLFIVAHRTPNKDKVLEKDIEHIQDRFALTHYKMEDVTTYSLLANSIHKNPEYENLLQEYKSNDVFRSTMKYVLDFEESKNISNLEQMLPIHPYSGLILSMIARQLKSSNRSIFSFLHAQNGFLSFLEENTDNLMDISYLWDYFLSIFEEDENLYPYISKFASVQSIKGINEHYIVIAKAILLLNILNKVIGGNEISFNRILKPNKANLEQIFNLTKYSTILDDALNLIGSRYMQPDSDGVYLISSATLPENEVFSEKERLKQGTYKSMLPILKPKENEIKKQFINGILRHYEIYFSEATIKDYDIKKYSSTKFIHDYALHLMFFFANEEHELLTLKNTLKEIAPQFENKIFVVVENSFTNGRYLKYIDYKARESVAKRHNHESESERNRQQADKLIEQYINSDLKSGSVVIYYGDEIRNGISMSNFANEINSIAKKIFYYGADNGLVNGYILWRLQNPTKTIPDNVISSFNREDLNSKLSGQNNPLINLLKEKNGNYVLDEDFEIKNSMDNHYIVKTIQEVQNIIDKKKENGDIHLGKALKILTKPPYGLYSNPISFTILSLALKRFDGKFYEIGNGRKIENSLLRDYIVNIFKFFDEDTKTELRVKFGTEHEDKLIDILKEIFELEEGLGVAQYTFKIKDWISNAKYPLWVVKYSINTNKNINDFIDKLTVLVNAHDEDIQFNDIKNLVEIVENNVLLQDIKILLQKNKFAEYFDLFIESLNLNIDKSYYDELYDFIKSRIRANQDSDISGWDENTVFRLVYEWEKEKFKPILPEQPIEPLTDEDESFDKPHYPVQSDKPTRDD
ncbi:MAG: hypothetical protein ACOCUI_00675, partial [bacterium]